MPAIGGCSFCGSRMPTAGNDWDEVLKNERVNRKMLPSHLSFIITAMAAKNVAAYEPIHQLSRFHSPVIQFGTHTYPHPTVLLRDRQGQRALYEGTGILSRSPVLSIDAVHMPLSRHSRTQQKSAISHVQVSRIRDF